MIEHGRYTSGRIAVANLSTTIEALEHRRPGVRASRTCSCFRPFSSCAATCSAGSPTTTGRIRSPSRRSGRADLATGLFVRGRLAARFHRFGEAQALLDTALAAGYPRREVDAERAALLQATGRYAEALLLRERMALEEPGIHTLGALASLQAEMDRWEAAEASYVAALDEDTRVSPLPAGQLIFEWAVSAMRRSELGRAEALFRELDAILPQHVPARGHRAEVALARGQLDLARSLIVPLVDASDDPEYRATYAEILAAAGEQRRVRLPGGARRRGLRTAARTAARGVCRPRGRVLHGHRQPARAGHGARRAQLAAARHAALTAAAGESSPRTFVLH